jgi:hypothetical protein
MTKQESHRQKADQVAQHLSNMAGTLQRYRQASGTAGELAKKLIQISQATAQQARRASRKPNWQHRGMGLARFKVNTSREHSGEWNRLDKMITDVIWDLESLRLNKS